MLAHVGPQAQYRTGDALVKTSTDCFIRYILMQSDTAALMFCPSY